MFVKEFFHGLTSYIIFGYYNFIASSVYGLPKPKRGNDGGFFFSSFLYIRKYVFISWSISIVYKRSLAPFPSST